jgi:hypothetical protein
VVVFVSSFVKICSGILVLESVKFGFYIGFLLNLSCFIIYGENTCNYLLRAMELLTLKYSVRVICLGNQCLFL